MASKITVFSVIMLVCIIQSHGCKTKRNVEEETKKPEEGTKTPEEESKKSTEGNKNPLEGIKDKFSGAKLPDSTIITSIGKIMKEMGPKEFIGIFKQFIKT